jgi:hypothetical protein
MILFQARADLLALAHRSTFSSDNRKIYIDNCATGCITNCIQDCHTTLKPIACFIKEIGWAFNVQMFTATIHWDFVEDDGVVEAHLISKIFYIPNTPHHLFSPQHLAQHHDTAKQ